jgi:hypothetical protein
MKETWNYSLGSVKEESVTADQIMVVDSSSKDGPTEIRKTFWVTFVQIGAN